MQTAAALAKVTPGQTQTGALAMPTPLEILLDPISLSVLGLYAAMILIEALFPARTLPSVRGWRTRATIVFAFYFFTASYLPMLWSSVLSGYQIADLESVDPFIGATIAILIYEFLVYAWHRTMHNVHWLWRSFHQMHHSAERLDSFGAFYFSPLDIVGFTLLSSLSLSVVGLSALAVTYFLYATMFLGVFQHLNVRTPRWLGYFLQRPESHSVHHSRGVHQFNYSDLPLFDLIFGTFRNPKDFVAECGFYDGASAQWPQILAFKDIAAHPANAVHASTGATSHADPRCK
jgi:sterol desaturase/sphingolipid hydroxylase (fatty acid hydroxylase superfamily)